MRAMAFAAISSAAASASLMIPSILSGAMPRRI
jgi:hypothetical protein